MSGMLRAKGVTAGLPGRDFFGDFSALAEGFASMQKTHRAAALAGNLKEVFSWGQEREKAFRNLVRSLEELVADARVGKEELAKAGEIVKKLLVEDEVLQKIILDSQEKVQGQLVAMRKGKEVLHGYSLNRGQITGPRYLSSRM